MTRIDSLSAMNTKDLCRAQRFPNAWENLIVTEIEFSRLCNVRDNTKSPTQRK